MIFLKRKRLLAPLTLLLALAVSVGAVAYWTASGTGSGSATIGTDAGVTIAPVTITGDLYPGGNVPVAFTINNPSTTTSVTVFKVVADVTVTQPKGLSGLPVGCLAADFNFPNVALNALVGVVIPPSGTYSSSGTLSMANTAVNQDACKNGTPTLHLKVDNS